MLLSITHVATISNMDQLQYALIPAAPSRVARERLDGAGLDINEVTHALQTCDPPVKCIMSRDITHEMLRLGGLDHTVREQGIDLRAAHNAHQVVRMRCLRDGEPCLRFELEELVCDIYHIPYMVLGSAGCEVGQYLTAALMRATALEHGLQPIEY